MSARTDTEEANTETTDAEDTVLYEAEHLSDAPDDIEEMLQEDTRTASDASAASPTAAGTKPCNLAEISAQLRESAAEIAEITAQAGRLGIAIDAAKALRDGTAPEALRRLVLDQASAAADARDIVAAPPSPVLPKSVESPIVAAAKKAASAGRKS